MEFIVKDRIIKPKDIALLQHFSELNQTFALVKETRWQWRDVLPWPVTSCVTYPVEMSLGFRECAAQLCFPVMHPMGGANENIIVAPNPRFQVIIGSGTPTPQSSPSTVMAFVSSGLVSGANVLARQSINATPGGVQHTLGLAKAKRPKSTLSLIIRGDTLVIKDPS
ncbi:MAG: hypothetical protein EB059_08265 [Alphaproteobacteria bacterium]|nr:hypothetical protein [Alphaproteobacteria bacterium]